MPDSKTKIIPAKQLEALRQESRDDESAEGVDVVFDEDGAEPVEMRPPKAVPQAPPRTRPHSAAHPSAHPATPAAKMPARSEPPDAGPDDEPDGAPEDWTDPHGSVPLPLARPSKPPPQKL